MRYDEAMSTTPEFADRVEVTVSTFPRTNGHIVSVEYYVGDEQMLDWPDDSYEYGYDPDADDLVGPDTVVNYIDWDPC